jgi:hypothetical protein
VTISPLAAHAVAADAGLVHRAERAQHLDLLVAHGGRVHAGGRLHGDDREDLQHVVLHHVAQRADAVIIGNAALQPDRLRHGDLHMLDGARVPQRLEQHVAKAQRQQVLYRFLAEIMVDPENPLLREQRADRVIDRLRGGKVVADRLFHGDAGGLGDETGGGKGLRGRREQGGRRREIDGNRAAIGGARALDQALHALALGDIDRAIADHPGKALQAARVQPVGREVELQALHDVLPESGIVHLRPAGGEDREPVRQQPVGEEIVERGKQHAVGEIARRAKDDESCRLP